MRLEARTTIGCMMLAASAVAASAADPTSATDVRPLLIGSKIPDVTLQTPGGAPYPMAKSLSDGPALIVFYRGGW